MKALSSLYSHCPILISSQLKDITCSAIVDPDLKKPYHLQELFIEDKNYPSLVGSIYKAEVVKNHTGLGACFVNIAPHTSAFLYNRQKEENLSGTTFTKNKSNNFYQGEILMVQVQKDALRGKNAFVTTRISIPGRLLVYLPTTSYYVGLSRQITDDRENIKEKAKVWSGCDSFIIRTQGAFASKEELKKELILLKKIWKSIEKKFQNQKGTGLLWQDVPLHLQVLRDYLTTHNEVWVDDKKNTLSIKKFISENVCDFKGRVSHYKDKTPLFDKYFVDLDPLLEKKVYLKNGGGLIIEEAEAGVIVDVNTHRAKSSKGTNYWLKTNLEAARELARQLRLRNCGGIIMIDFIDMPGEKDRDKLMRTFIKELEKDRVYTQVFPLSPLGIVEMTRKRRRASLIEIMCKTCESCNGYSYIRKKL